MKLNQLEQMFDDLVDEYNSDSLKGSGDTAERDALQNYSDQFTNLYRLIRPICKEVYGWRTQHDDKACTAFRAREAKKIMRDEQASWNKSYEMSASTEEYEDFLKERIFYYESWDSVSHLRDTIKQYIINIGQRLTNF